jgi:hypothetical protein
VSQAPKGRFPISALYVIVTVVFWMIVVGLGIGLPAAIATTMFSEKPMSIQATVPTTALDELPPQLGEVTRVSMSVPIDKLTPPQITVYHGVVAIAGVFILYAIWRLRSLVRSVRDGSPFSRENVQVLRLLGWLLLVGYPVMQYIVGGLHEWILSTGGPPISAQPDVDPLSFGAVFGGLCLLVLAEVFAHGIALREDVEGTV